MTPVPKKRRGRPLATKPKRPVTVRLDDDTYDRYCRASYASLEHISTIMRGILRRYAPRSA